METQVQKIRAEIERLLKEQEDNFQNFNSEYKEGISAGPEMIDRFIDSLQEGQTEPSNNLVDVDAVREDFMAEVYRVLDADPTNDRANAIINAFDSLPTVTQEQSKVDLEADFEEEWERFEDWVDSYNLNDYPTCYEPKQIARHFAKWGAEHLKKIEK